MIEQKIIDMVVNQLRKNNKQIPNKPFGIITNATLKHNIRKLLKQTDTKIANTYLEILTYKGEKYISIKNIGDLK